MKSEFISWIHTFTPILLTSKYSIHSSIVSFNHYYILDMYVVGNELATTKNLPLFLLLLLCLLWKRLQECTCITNHSTLSLTLCEPDLDWTNWKALFKNRSHWLRKKIGHANLIGVADFLDQVFEDFALDALEAVEGNRWNEWDARGQAGRHLPVFLQQLGTFDTAGAALDRLPVHRIRHRTLRFFFPFFRSSSYVFTPTSYWDNSRLSSQDYIIHLFIFDYNLYQFFEFSIFISRKIVVRNGKKYVNFCVQLDTWFTIHLKVIAGWKNYRYCSFKYRTVDIILISPRWFLSSIFIFHPLIITWSAIFSETSRNKSITSVLNQSMAKMY